MLTISGADWFSRRGGTCRLHAIYMNETCAIRDSERNCQVQEHLSLPEIKSGRIDGANLRDVGQTVDATEGHSLRRFAPQHVELVSKNQDFRLKPCSRLSTGTAWSARMPAT